MVIIVAKFEQITNYTDSWPATNSVSLTDFLLFGCFSSATSFLFEFSLLLRLFRFDCLVVIAKLTWPFRIITVFRNARKLGIARIVSVVWEIQAPSRAVIMVICSEHQECWSGTSEPYYQLNIARFEAHCEAQGTVGKRIEAICEINCFGAYY